VREWSSSLGDEAVGLAASAGLILDEWQADALRDLLSLGDDDRWLHFEAGINVARQNGKGGILEARELAALFLTGESLAVHSAHEFATSQEHFRRIEDLIQSTPELHSRVKAKSGYRHSHGDESINLKDGRRLVFKTRTKSGLRGFAGVDLLVMDEAMIINEASHGAMMPTLRASQAVHGPQFVYAGSAVDQEIHEHGIVWARIRERGQAGVDPSLCYIEYSVEAEHPDDVTDEMAADVGLWHQANPALGIRISEEHMERELRAMSPRTFAVELLGVGDWPATDGSQDVVVSAEDWAAVEDTDSVLVDPICLAFDVSPDRRTTISASGLNERGKLHIEVVNSRSGTGWVAERLEELYRSHEVVEIVCDGFGPSASIARRVDEVGITVRRMGSGDYARACGLFADAVGERALRHIGQDDLNASVKGARTRPLVDRWAWSRTKSVADAGPVIACSLALLSAEESDLGGLEIF
jgi:hypothetical protein